MITVAVSPIPKGIPDKQAIEMIQNPQNQGVIIRKYRTTRLLMVLQPTKIITWLMIPEDLIKVKEQQITFIKNGITYGLIFDVQNFDQDESNFNITLYSFQVQ